jgi:hypothetical protein
MGFVKIVRGISIAILERKQNEHQTEGWPTTPHVFNALQILYFLTFHWSDCSVQSPIDARWKFISIRSFIGWEGLPTVVTLGVEFSSKDL